ncbi:MAG: KUP/HAK/KT family potassium transporter [Candidatus Eremiobacteraeota bacterium]|nr:KUP/HAK/KT family potassium transporter [Candidatus Eremiobacteraeota bacterium]
MADQVLKAPQPARTNFPVLALAALGVVFGDIGTSPLYAFKLCFTGDFPAALTQANVLGILSLIFWALIVVVCIKYVTFMLRADNEGQGGTIALLALLSPRVRSAMPLALTSLGMLVLFGESMLYGDGVITPAISVTSAVEGLDVWTKAAHPYVVPVSVLVLVILFSLQSRGTDRIGKLFGPIMLLWFAAIGGFGFFGILQHPGVLSAFNPIFAIEFFARNGLRSVLIFGAVVLCVTGVEALYADLAHFGRRPITLAWYAIVFPSLLLNYFGQGALTLAHAQALQSPFFSLVPRLLLVPMVLLATVATVIASQALISGVFSLTQQLMQLGFCPRFEIVHTSRHYAGQIYIPAVNVVLAITCIALVLAFRSSEAFGGAYGLAVTITMLVSSVTFFRLLRRNWNWPLWRAVPLVALFLAWDVPFLGGNLSKVLSGGWVPLMMATTLFVFFTTWNRGRRRLLDGMAEQRMPLEEFLSSAPEPTSAGGIAIFVSPDSQGIPFASRHEWLRSHVASDTIILLTIAGISRPYLDAAQRVAVEELSPRLLRIKASYGFMQQAKMSDVLELLQQQCPRLDLSHVTYYLASPKMSDDPSPHGLPPWQRTLYRWMARNARPLTDSLGLPPNRIVEFGVEVKI